MPLAFPESLPRNPVTIEGVQADFLTTRSQSVKEQSASEPWIAQGRGTDLPGWVQEIVPGADDAEFISNGGMRKREVSGPLSSLRTVVIPGAVFLSAESLTHATREAYEAILDGIDPESISRVWNFVPGINTLMEPGFDRYMMFNGGRFAAFKAVLPEGALHPVASGVGHAGDDLVLHALVGGNDVRRVMNSRQRAPHKYSTRFGPLPPAFSRAALTRFGIDDWLLVSGTASVVGEDSHHIGDATGQLTETIDNLRCVREEAQAFASTSVEFDVNTEWLVYTTDMMLADEISMSLCTAFKASNERIMVRNQRLCRPELIVEIECATKLGCD